QSAAVRECTRESKEYEIAPGHERRGQAIVGDLDGHLARQRRFRHGSERIELDDVIVAETAGPLRPQRRHVFAQRRPDLQLGAVALAIVEADGLDEPETLERP